MVSCWFIWYFNKNSKYWIITGKLRILWDVLEIKSIKRPQGDTVYTYHTSLVWVPQLPLLIFTPLLYTLRWPSRQRFQHNITSALLDFIQPIQRCHLYCTLVDFTTSLSLIPHNLQFQYTFILRYYHPFFISTALRRHDLVFHKLVIAESIIKPYAFEMPRPC